MNILIDTIDEINKPPSTSCEGGVPHNSPKVTIPTIDILMTYVATEIVDLIDSLENNVAPSPKDLQATTIEPTTEGSKDKAI